MRNRKKGNLIVMTFFTNAGVFTYKKNNPKTYSPWYFQYLEWTGALSLFKK